MDVQVVKRRRGNVIPLLVEINASQYSNFDKLCKELGLTKTKAVAAAINIWMNMVSSKDER